MDKKDAEYILDFCAMLLGNKEYRQLGKEESKWFKKIFDAVDNDEPNFLDFVLTFELRFENIISKEELNSAKTSLSSKYKNLIIEKRRQNFSDFISGTDFDNLCKTLYYLIKGDINN